MSERRLENLETVVRALRDEVRQLREEMVRVREGRPATIGKGVGAPPNRASPALQPEAPERPLRAGDRGGSPPDSQPTPGRTDHDHRSVARAIAWSPKGKGTGNLGVEAMIGRYGTLAVAAVLVVMGVGAFVTWAATRFVIGPTARVALGALGALALAALGRRVAARGSVAFGSTMLALALAVAHVDAWAAGPVLHVVPDLVALGAAALASIALAALALRERNESLFAVGVGGALLAPYVTGDRESSALLLLAYGWVVVASALAAARPREWILTTRLVAVGAALYTVMAVGATTGGITDALAVGAFPIACAWAAYLWGPDRQRADMSLWFVALGAGALFIMSVRDPILAFIALAVLGTASTHVMLESRAATRSQVVAGALVLPLAFLLCALAAVEFASQRGALVATGWTLAAVALSRVSHGRRDLHLAAASFAGLLAIILALHQRPVECVVALAAAAVGIAYIARRADARPALVPFLAALLVAAVWSHALLAGRAAYAYVPFLTPESLAAAAAVAAAFAAWKLVRGMPDRIDLVAALFFGGALFLWARAELEYAIRPEIATFSLILYYAGFGIIAIAIGRRHRLSELRIAGILLALYAAAKAVVQASGLTTIGLRVGSYLLVGGFLLAVAYWYRAATMHSADQPATQP